MRQSRKTEEIRKAFDERLEALRQELLQAHTHFNIWEQLWPTEEVVRIINKYKGFFLPAIFAHYSTFVVKVTNAVNPSEEASFEHIFVILENAPYLASDLDINSLRNRLEQLRPTLLAIGEARQRFAHVNLKPSKKKSSILYGQAKKVLEELQKIFDEIHRSYKGGNRWSFKILEYEHTSYVLSQLK